MAAQAVLCELTDDNGRRSRIGGCIRRVRLLRCPQELIPTTILTCTCWMPQPHGSIHVTCKRFGTMKHRTARLGGTIHWGKAKLRCEAQLSHRLEVPTEAERADARARFKQGLPCGTTLDTESEQLLLPSHTCSSRRNVLLCAAQVSLGPRTARAARRCETAQQLNGCLDAILYWCGRSREPPSFLICTGIC